jgi:hypothetical protein
LIRLEAAARPGDALVLLPSRAYAVVHGLPDRAGRRYAGEPAATHAARLVAATLERLLGGPPPPAESIIPTLTATLHEAYLRHATLAEAEAHWGARLCCTLALALHDGADTHLLLAGDCAIRLNGRDTLDMPRDIDRIAAISRRHATAAQAEADCVATLPHVPRSDIAHLLAQGIEAAEGDYRNNPDSVLGHACLDGFPIPRTLLRIATVPTRSIATLDLHTQAGAEDSRTRIGVVVR